MNNIFAGGREADAERESAYYEMEERQERADREFEMNYGLTDEPKSVLDSEEIMTAL